MDLKITTKITKYDYSDHTSYQIMTKSEKYGYSLYNVASSEAEAENITNIHKAQLEQIFAPKYINTEEATSKKSKRKSKEDFIVIDEELINEENMSYIGTDNKNGD